MKILVEIDLENHSLEDYFNNLTDWHPTSDRKYISIDSAYIPTDPSDDSYSLLRLVSVLP